MNKLAPYYKALVAFVAPGAVAIGTAVTEGSQGGSSITSAEWISALVACVVTSAAVYGTPNRDPEGDHQDESVQPPQDPEHRILGKA